jgi:hypothetical protein
VAQTYSERVMMIADVIQQYSARHPQAVDTAEGIRAWWVSPNFYGVSSSEVQSALDYLTEAGRMRQIVIVGSAVAYGAPNQPHDPAARSS